MYCKNEEETIISQRNARFMASFTSGTNNLVKRSWSDQVFEFFVRKH